MIHPLAQLSDILPGWGFLVLIASPLGGGVLSLVIYRRASSIIVTTCILYYALFFISAILADDSAIFGFGFALLLLIAPLLGLFNLIAPFFTEPPRTPPEPRGFPVEVKDRSE